MEGDETESQGDASVSNADGKNAQSEVARKKKLFKKMMLDFDRPQWKISLKVTHDHAPHPRKRLGGTILNGDWKGLSEAEKRAWISKSDDTDIKLAQLLAYHLKEKVEYLNNPRYCQLPRAVKALTITEVKETDGQITELIPLDPPTLVFERFVSSLDVATKFHLSFEAESDSERLNFFQSLYSCQNVLYAVPFLVHPKSFNLSINDSADVIVIFRPVSQGKFSHIIHISSEFGHQWRVLLEGCGTKLKVDLLELDGHALREKEAESGLWFGNATISSHNAKKKLTVRNHTMTALRFYWKIESAQHPAFVVQPSCGVLEAESNATFDFTFCPAEIEVYRQRAVFYVDTRHAFSFRADSWEQFQSNLANADKLAQEVIASKHGDEVSGAVSPEVALVCDQGFSTKDVDNNGYIMKALDIELIGVGDPFDIEIYPPLLLFSEMLVQGKTYTREIHLRNNTLADVTFSWQVSETPWGIAKELNFVSFLPITGKIVALGSTTVSVTLRATKIGPIQEAVTCSFMDTGHLQLPLLIEGCVQGPRVSILQPMLDFGLVQVGTTDSTQLTLTNRSIVEASFKLLAVCEADINVQLSQAMSNCKDELFFRPDSGTVLARGTTNVKVDLHAKACGQKGYAIVCQVVDGLSPTQYALVRAFVDSPKAYFDPCRFDLGITFLYKKLSRTATLHNLTGLTTYYRWPICDINIGDSSSIKIDITPRDGELAPYGSQQIVFRMTPLEIGEKELILTCDILGADVPIGVIFRTYISDFRCSYHVVWPSELDNKADPRSNIKALSKLLIDTTNPCSLDFGNTCQLGCVYWLRLVVQNHTDIFSKIHVGVNKYGSGYPPPLAKEDYVVLSGLTGRQLTLPQATDSKSVLKLKNRKVPPIIDFPNEVHQKYWSVFGHLMVSRRLEVEMHNILIRNGEALSLLVYPGCEGLLESQGQWFCDIFAFSCLPGFYSDILTCSVGGLPPAEIPISIGVTGTPLFARPQHLEPRGYQHPKINSSLVLRWPPVSVGNPRRTKRFWVANVSPYPLEVMWMMMVPEPGRLATIHLVHADESWVRVSLLGNPEFGPVQLRLDIIDRERVILAHGNVSFEVTFDTMQAAHFTCILVGKTQFASYPDEHTGAYGKRPSRRVTFLEKTQIIETDTVRRKSSTVTFSDSQTKKPMLKNELVRITSSMGSLNEPVRTSLHALSESSEQTRKPPKTAQQGLLQDLRAEKRSSLKRSSLQLTGQSLLGPEKRSSLKRSSIMLNESARIQQQVTAILDDGPIVFDPSQEFFAPLRVCLEAIVFEPRLKPSIDDPVEYFCCGAVPSSDKCYTKVVVLQNVYSHSLTFSVALDPPFYVIKVESGLLSSENEDNTLQTTDPLGLSCVVLPSEWSIRLTINFRPEPEILSEHKDLRFEKDILLKFFEEYTQVVPVQAKVFFPAVKVLSECIWFGSVVINASQTLVFSVTNASYFDSQWRLVKEGLQEELVEEVPTSGLKKKSDNRKPMSPEPALVLPLVEEPPAEPFVKDPFHVDIQGGLLPGRGTEEAVRHVVTVTFVPVEAKLYRQVFRIEVADGRGCSLVMEGQGITQKPPETVEEVAESKGPKKGKKASSLVLVLTAALDRIVKNASWRKHGKLVQDCKAVLDNLVAFIPSAGAESPLFDGAVRISTTDAELLVQPLLAACDLQSAKVIEPALDCFQKLIVHGHLVGEIGTGNDSQSESSLIHRILDAVCKCHDLGEEIIELAILKTLLTAVVSTSLSIHGDHLLRAISTCYNIFLGSKVAANQTSAKATLTQILRVIFTRMEADSASVPLQPVVLTDLLEAERTTSDTFVQNFLTKVALDFDVVLHVGPKLVQHDDAFSAATGAESSNTMDMLESSDKDAVDAKAWEQVDKDMKDMELDVEIGNKFKRDAFLVFRALCCLSMKKPQQEGTPDPLAIRSKVLALELLKLVLENAGTSFCFNPKFLDAIKQYLCLSLMQNCAVSDILSVFQMSCSIFLSLIAKFRASLKTEIGVFFPMIVLRVIENVIQPNYQQKMTVLCFIEKLSADPQAMGDWMEKQLGALNSPYFNSSDVETGKLDAASVSTAGASATEVGDEIAEPLETDQASTESAVTFEQRRVHKLELQEGIKVFNQKPHKGIDFLVKAKKVEKNPEEVAKFLLSTTGLNKSMIGDYLGEKEEFSLKVMHAYVDSFNFHNMEFDESIRTFLMGFRLPGEAQKIDRIMEKFAERYCICNPKAFTSADTAYVLAYSVIMLNTDAHNVMVKDKMSKAAFIKNNRGIDDGKDLLEEFMGGLYDRIVKKEIKMKADNVIPVTKPAGKDNKFPAGIDNILNIVIRKPKEEKLFESSDDAIRYMQDQLKEKAEKPQSAYYAAIDVEIVKPMVEVSWGPMLAGLSVPLDKSDDEVVTSPCLEGFRHAIHITSVMRMQIQRDAFVTSLAKFTLLHSPVDIKQKNVNAIKDAWEHVLTCVSRFDQLYLIGEGALPDATFFSNDPEKTKLSTAPKRKGRLHFAALAARRGSYDSTGGRQSPIPGAVTAEQMCNLVSNLGLLGQINSNEANKIFTRSQALSSEGIVDFVKALCKVSMDELRSPTDPRVFSLTKIVEISHFNMNRIRLVWSRMWNTLSDYFVTVGCSSNFSVAMYAMDSLRQLAMKFMDREELANYNFQNQFMRPFVIIMQRSASVEIREFIIRCVSQMVCTRVGNVKSGWKITFMVTKVFTTAATDRDSGIVHLAFETVEKVVRDYFQHITETENTIFTDCVNCLLAFINNKFNDDISLNALAFLRFCALKLGEGELSTCRNSPEKVPNTESGPEQDDHLFFWFPLLAGLAELTYDSRTAIRKSAVHVLFDVLQCHGHVFSTSSWEQIYNTVLFPLFDSARRSIKLQNVDSEKDMDAWLYETCSLALQPLDFLKIHHEKIVGITIASFVRLIVKGGPQFSKVDWVDILQGLQSVAEETFPNVMQIVTFMEGASSEGFTSDEDSKLQCFLAELKFHSTVQLLLAVREIYDAFGPKLASPHVTLLLGVLNVIVVHAHKVNNDLFLRNKIYKLQLSSQMGDPPLLWLESESSQAYMEILQRLHEDNSVLLKNVDVEARFVEFCKEVLQVYAKTSTFTHQPQRLKLQWMIPVSYTRRRELTARAPLVIMTLRALSRFRNTPFQKYLSSFFPVLTSLVGCEHGSMEVQFALSDLFNLQYLMRKSLFEILRVRCSSIVAFKTVARFWILLKEENTLTRMASHEHCCGGMFWAYIVLSICLVVFAGIMSGLTLGLMSLELVDLEVLMKSGSLQDRKHAEIIYPVVKEQHLLLCTLLICNALAMEALPIFLDAVVNAWSAVLISVTLILLFGEILPQAICSRYGLAIGAKMTPFVRVLVWICFPISYPISKLLDSVLGKDHVALFRRAELKTLVGLHDKEAGKGGELTHDEATIITGALDLTEKTAEDAMTPISKAFCVDINVKTLLTVRPETATPLINLTIRKIPRVGEKMPLYDILNEFQKGHSHMAVVVRNTRLKPESLKKKHSLDRRLSSRRFSKKGSQVTEIQQEFYPAPDGESTPWKSKSERNASEDILDVLPLVSVNDDEAVGIITMEDVIEELLQEEIWDESDQQRELYNKLRASLASPRTPRHIVPTSISEAESLMVRTSMQTATSSHSPPPDSPGSHSPPTHSPHRR
ncbi:hypothetical protein SELMODRAFT_420360 [Selaginella moellendorffii]|uniref:Uncharacterized protein n=1 Tax=Selaginella moellendorffii TaxID=88036 RepID=D8SBR4_SELML|nr:hypothetical protein SELMODRAFT_420360 [Selaginella moellendorffii]